MSKLSDPIVIVAAKRSAIGSFQGQFAGVPAPQLGAAAIRAALAASGVAAEQVDEVLMGCVLPAGIGQAPARQAALAAGVPTSVPCSTISKVCGSGMRSIMFAHDMIVAGSARIVVGGGMESMTNAPYFLPKARDGYRLGHGQLLDHMFFDGLQDAYEGKLMGTYAEDAVARYGFTRAEQDAYTITSVERAQRAVAEGSFRDEIGAVLVKSRKGEVSVIEDETPGKCDIAKIPTLKPAFQKDGTVTPANSSSISDGAAALVLMRASEASARQLRPLATIIGHAGYAHTPGLFTSAPVGAIGKLLEAVGWSTADVDLYEINDMAKAAGVALPKG